MPAAGQPLPVRVPVLRARPRVPGPLPWRVLRAGLGAGRQRTLSDSSGTDGIIGDDFMPPCAGGSGCLA